VGTTLFFSSLGLINGMIAKNFDGISIIPNFVLTPLTYLGGVFYSVGNLPDIWKTISHANPVFYIVDLFRYGFLGTMETSLPVAIGVLLGGCVVFAGIGLWIIGSGKGVRG
jgi:ABC-2 type transport system permease protein